VDLDTLAKKYQKRYGHQAASSGKFKQHTASTSTGILSLDYALGTRGWPEGTVIEVFGPPDIGKSSIIGFNAIVEAQKKGKVCGIVALEPGFDPSWAEKNGVDLDKVLILWPDDGQQAFDMLFDMVTSPDISLIIFDSIGAVLRPSEAGDKGKPSQGGQSALITWGVKRIQMPAWKRQKTVILLNQIRDDMNAMFAGAVESPGGHALKHTAEIRVQLKPGKDRFTVKEGEGDQAHDVLIGRSVIAVIKRSKKDEGTNKRAIFNHFSKETPEYPFGVDKMTDIFNTAKRTGVLRTGGGGWYYHDKFPDGKLRSEDAVLEYLRQNESVVDAIREQVLGSLYHVEESKND
jgi:recombination protein RecA